MRIAMLTPGAGGMYCGACMRDNALAAALNRAGHDALLLPLYTPLLLDEAPQHHPRIFFGGVNVFLQQQSALFRRTPAWFDRLLDAPGLLRFAARWGLKTSPATLGALTVSMLQGEDGRQAKELDKLAAWLARGLAPEVICLSNALLLGMAGKLRRALSVPVCCTLQGEDTFLDGLPEPHRERAWGLLREKAQGVDVFIAVSRYHADLMSARLNLPAARVHVIHNGIDLTGYAPAAQPPARPTLGYLARLTPLKGLNTLVEAFRRLRAKNAVPGLRLRIAGSVTSGDRAYVDGLRAALARDGLAADVDILPNLDRREKIAFLQSLSVFSVPATYGESFGLYVLEALACGVSVVQPRHAAFPEILALTGGGVLCAPDDPADLAVKCEALLLDRDRAAALGRAGCERVHAGFGIDRVAREFGKVLSAEY